MTKTIFEVAGMNCMHCVGKVESILRDQAGVEKVKVNLKKGEAKVKYDESVVTADQLIESIKTAGYTATTK
ncbi:copper-binding protein [Halolactibacillus alkaliphilus]|uniref:Copper chaperone CopZ n=1 Tax=Halolactibacillus alkaliphilus TaxID=442899 RepID=A0A511X203_9BACI|nr:cation transporter [Halolactibacillus alkaliphilus]GEN56975.1 copper-binding protein [Halolactibacillus alkaliphilus]GGN71559.1 copper-binding protein [Halolactibacillus alkaliphilus]SFO84666.1 copper chaperone [Halolactibacillus alkaliphilus]